MKIKFLVLLCLFFKISDIHCQKYSLIITEIFADPTPTKGLPEKEFIEIYNPNPFSVSLKGYYFVYNDKPTPFADNLILANEYLIVCKKGNELEFANFGKVITLSVFSLNNDGASLAIIDNKQNLIFDINYSKTWYTPKFEEGYSLEMIDLNYPCLKQKNWKSSSDKLGATPGKINAINAVNPDTDGPKVLESSNTKDAITIIFDEELEKNSILNLKNFSIDNADYNIVKINFDLKKPEAISLSLNKDLAPNETFNLKIIEVQDCSNNVSNNILLNFSNYSPPDSSQLLISEILFNPLLDGEDFVELYNNSSKSINLKNWVFANKDSKNKIANHKIISTTDLILKPNQFLAITSNKTQILENYITTKNRNIFETKALPSYNNDKGTVILIDPENNIFDSLAYKETFHVATIKNRKGVSLERLSFLKPTNDSKNWYSASSEVNYATPGYENSQIETDKLENIIIVEPEVFNPYQTNDKMSTYIKYNLSLPGIIANVEVLDKTGFVINILRPNSLLGTIGQIEWDGKDNSGNIMPVGYYVFKIKLVLEKTTETFIRKVVLGSY
jgi:hypothetical protein